MLLTAAGWSRGRYPRLVEWLQRMHERGALLCSACSGVFLLAETGLFDGKDATVHFAYAQAFSALYPDVTIHPERVLVISGRRQELISSGASTRWHDLVMYLIVRYAGATIAQELGRSFALQWHVDGLTPYHRLRRQKRPWRRRDSECAGVAAPAAALRARSVTRRSRKAA